MNSRRFTCGWPPTLSTPSLDHLVGEREERQRNSKPMTGVFCELHLAERLDLFRRIASSKF